MSFAYPWLLLGPLVFLPALFIRRSSEPAACPSSSLFVDLPKSWKLTWRRPLLNTLSLAAVVLLSIAAARPQQVSVLSDQEQARNLMLALDTSGSMQTEDFQSGRSMLSRLSAVKAVVSDFVSSRTEDRMGLVIFGSQAYLQCPLTMDRQFLSQLVQILEVGMAGDATALGDALALSLKRIAELPKGSKAVVLLTDGVNTAGRIQPLQAAKIAKDLGIRVYTIGIGNPNTAARMQNNFFIPTDLRQFEFDESTLRKIAETTGASYYRADSFEGLKTVYEQIDQLEKSRATNQSKKIVREHFAIFAMLGLLCYALYWLLNSTIFLKVP